MAVKVKVRLGSLAAVAMVAMELRDFSAVFAPRLRALLKLLFQVQVIAVRSQRQIGLRLFCSPSHGLRSWFPRSPA